MKIVLFRLGLSLFIIAVLNFFIFPNIQNFNYKLDSVSYQPNFKNESKHDIKNNLKDISKISTGIRTYGLYHLNYIIKQSKQLNMKVICGITLKNKGNKARLNKFIDIVKKNNIKKAIIGNETLLTNAMTVNQLISNIKYFKKKDNILVSTAEPSFIWNKYPKLSNNVDFITVHILPYWIKVKSQDALKNVKSEYNKLLKYKKPILIGEFGWPSGGLNNSSAVPSLRNEIETINTFHQWAVDNHIQYNIIEGIDQPMKTKEGAVGKHWGLLNYIGYNKILVFNIKKNLLFLSVFISTFPLFYKQKLWDKEKHRYFKSVVYVSLCWLVLCFFFKIFYHELFSFIILFREIL